MHSAEFNAGMLTNFISLELIGLTLMTTSLLSVFETSGSPMWYTSVSGEMTRIRVYSVCFTCTQRRVSVSFCLQCIMHCMVMALTQRCRDRNGLVLKFYALYLHEFITTAHTSMRNGEFTTVLHATVTV